MPRVPRRFLPDGVYHVTTGGVDGCPVYRDDRDRLVFLALLAEVVAEQGWRVEAYCLMGTHYHLVVACTREQLSDGLHRLNGVHAQRFNLRHGRRGHLFGDRFHARVIETDEHLANALEYVLHNPVRAGLVRRPRDWRWSGLRPGRAWPADAPGRTHVRRLHCFAAWLPTSSSSTAPASTTSRTSPSACRGTA